MYFVSNRADGGFIVHDTTDGTDEFISSTDLFYLVHRKGVKVVNLNVVKEGHSFKMSVIKSPVTKMAQVYRLSNPSATFTETYPLERITKDEIALLRVRGANMFKCNTTDVDVKFDGEII